MSNLIIKPFIHQKAFQDRLIKIIQNECKIIGAFWSSFAALNGTVLDGCYPYSPQEWRLEKHDKTTYPMYLQLYALYDPSDQWEVLIKKQSFHNKLTASVNITQDYILTSGGYQIEYAYDPASASENVGALSSYPANNDGVWSWNVKIDEERIRKLNIVDWSLTVYALCVKSKTDKNLKFEVKKVVNEHHSESSAGPIRNFFRNEIGFGENYQPTCGGYEIYDGKVHMEFILNDNNYNSPDMDFVVKFFATVQQGIQENTHIADTCAIAITSPEFSKIEYLTPELSNE